MTSALHFPALHRTHPRGWINDPNGMARVNGVWHVFFQHNPHAPVHDRIAWGHATSRDLAHWELQPVAFSPSPGAGAFSLEYAGCLAMPRT